jgi:type VI secretion system secreted protein Hcp
VAIYMKYGSIDGSTTTSGIESWIQLHSFQWGVGRGVSLPHGAEDTREGSEPSISEVVVTKRMEKSSIKLWQDAVGGDFSSKVTIRFTTTTANKVESFLEYEFTNTGLSGYSVSAGADDPPEESISLNFAKVTWKYGVADAKTGIKFSNASWDLTQQKGS